jgi:hypothetical protein
VDGIRRADLGAGRLVTEVTPPAGWTADSPDSDGRTLVWSESNGDRWRVTARDLATGHDTIIATGTGGGVAPRVAGGFVAMNVGTQGAFANVIEVRSSADGHLIRRIRKNGRIQTPDVDADGTVVVTVGKVDQDDFLYDGTLYAERPDGTETKVAFDAYDARIDGGRIVWVRDPGSTGYHGVVWTTAPGEAAHAIGAPNGGWQGARWPTVGDGVMAWSEVGFAGDSYKDWLVLARPGQQPVLVRTEDQVVLPAIADGWLVWGGLDDSGWLSMSGLPLSDLPSSAP